MVRKAHTRHAAKPDKKKGPPRTLSSQERHDRKQRVLTQGTPSVAGSIADAVVIKSENLFFLSRPDGSVPLDDGHGFGLYYHDCRFLSGYELKLAGVQAETLVSTAAWGYRSAFQLTNPDLRTRNDKLIRKEEIGIRWERMIDAGNLSLEDSITLQNFKSESVAFDLELAFSSGFEDVFAIRGLLPERPGRLRHPEWKNGVLIFRYDGADRVHRSLSVLFSPSPDKVKRATARFQIRLQPGERRALSVSLVVAESHTTRRVAFKQAGLSRVKRTGAQLRRSRDRWMAAGTMMRSDSALLNAVLDRSFRDLYALRSRLESRQYFAAGLPWFGTLFGRDSIITALQTLAFDPEISAQTLRLLAEYQCRVVDDWRDGQPGKILHELRVGEMASIGEIPHTPYYGTIDATPLFLVLLARHAAWTGDLSLFRELKSHVELALDWITKYGDLDGDGYVQYASTSENGLINQGWKDSGDAIVDAEGMLAKPPIALVEVQGYVFMAKMAMADLYARSGDPEKANLLRKEAKNLRSRFNHDFWLEEEGIYALALERDRQPLAVVSSNAGQTLWSGIADTYKARRTVERLMAADMHNGWGVRTLSERERRYNPIGYHLGTVWPHDNALIAAGFKRYGFHDAARRVFTGILEASMHFQHYRLPEVFAGFHRKQFGVPVRYPVACHPQAWAAGSVPFMLQTCLGLVPEAFEQRLRIGRPVLPEIVERVEIRRLRVGRAHTDLRFQRREDGTMDVDVLNVDGPLDIVHSDEKSV